MDKNQFDTLKNELLKEYNIFLMKEDRKLYENELKKYKYLNKVKYRNSELYIKLYIDNQSIEIIPIISDNFKISYEYKLINEVKDIKIKNIRYEEKKEYFVLYLEDSFKEKEYLSYSIFDYNNLIKKLKFHAKVENTKTILTFTNEFAMRYINKKHHVY